MAEENNKIGGRVGLDITDFKANITALNREIKVIESGFKATAAGLGDWGKSAEGLQEKIKALTGVTEAQAKKVENLKEIYKKVVDEKGKDSKAAQELEIKINNETAALNKNQRELGQTADALKNFGNETDSADKKTGNFTENLKKIGGTVAKGAAIGVAAVGTAAAAAAVGAFEMAKSVGESADELLTLSAKTGISTKQLQEMQYASRFVDVEVETMTKSMVKLTKSMDDARGGSKDAAAAFDTLNIKTTDQNGKLRDAKQVWTEAITALGGIKNETERDAVALQLFGKSAQDLNPLIKAGADELNRLGIEANAVGAVLSDDALAAAGKFDDVMQTLDASVKGLVGSIGVAAVPMLTELVSSVTSIVPKVTEAIKTGNWEEAGTAVSEGINGVGKQITDALPGFITILSGVIGGLVKTFVAVVPTILPMIADTALTLLNTLINIITENGPTLISTGMDVLVTLITGILDALPKLIPMAVELILSLVDAILEALPELIPAAIETVVALANGIIDALPKLIEKIPKIVETIVDVIVKNLPLLIDAAIKIILELAKAIIENLPLLIDATIKIISAIANGLIENIPTLLLTVPKIFKALVDAFVELKWGQIGKDIIAGITKGIVDSAKGLVNAASNAAKSALSAAKSVLGINSPSRVFKEQVGEMIGAGMAQGISDSTSDVNRAMNGLSNQLVANGEMNINSNLRGSSPASASTSRGISVQIVNQGTLVGTNGFREFAEVISKELSDSLGLSLGGAY